MLNKDPNKRITASDAYQHKWITSIHKTGVDLSPLQNISKVHVRSI